MNTRRILWTLTCVLLALGGQAAAQELGDGRGIDHVSSLVRLENFAAAASVWTDQLGFSVTPVRFKHKKIPYLGGRGAEVRYNNNTLVLLEPDGPGLVADFAAERREGILGVSLQVGNLRVARDLVSGNTGLNLQTFKYRGRARFLIPASLTHGFLIEMVK